MLACSKVLLIVKVPLSHFGPASCFLLMVVVVPDVISLSGRYCYPTNRVTCDYGCADMGSVESLWAVGYRQDNRQSQVCRWRAGVPACHSLATGEYLVERLLCTGSEETAARLLSSQPPEVVDLGGPLRPRAEVFLMRVLQAVASHGAAAVIPP